MECPELFSHLEQDRHGNLICFQQVTNPDGTVGEVQLSHAEAERLVKYRFELQELRQFDVEEAEEQGAKDRYAAEVNQFRNFQVWVDGGHPAEDWPYIPEETRMSRWDGTQLDKRYFSYSRPDGTFVTTRLRGGNQPQIIVLVQATREMFCELWPNQRCSLRFFGNTKPFHYRTGHKSTQHSRGRARCRKSETSG